MFDKIQTKDFWKQLDIMSFCPRLCTYVKNRLLQFFVVPCVFRARSSQLSSLAIYYKHRQITICYIGQFVKSFTDCVPSSITYINITITTIQLLNIRAGRGRQVLVWWTTGLEVWARLSLHNILLRKRLLSSTRFFSIPITI